MVGFILHVLEKWKFHSKKRFDTILVSVVPDNTFQKGKKLGGST